MLYVGLDVHKRTISYCVKQADGALVREGRIESRRAELRAWMASFAESWMAALEATLFTGWIYDCLREQAAEVKVAHPLLLKAIVAGKHKSDRVDAATICDLLRSNLLPECHMQAPETRALRRVLRYRNLVVGQVVQMKNRIAGLLLETGVEYDRSRLHRRRYFTQLLERLGDVPDSVVELLKLSRASVEERSKLERQLLRGLERDGALQARVARLMTIPGVGVVTALTWALEIGAVSRFGNVKQAISYCGLCGREQQSGERVYRTPLSKQRNRYLQSVLVEAAKLAPRVSPELAAVYEQARKLVAYLLAVDRRAGAFVAAGARQQVA